MGAGMLRRAARSYPVVVGSDVIYYERDAEALVATVLAHLDAGCVRKSERE